jgi:hypothetical protein
MLVTEPSQPHMASLLPMHRWHRRSAPTTSTTERLHRGDARGVWLRSSLGAERRRTMTREPAGRPLQGCVGGRLVRTRYERPERYRRTDLTHEGVADPAAMSMTGFEPPSDSGRLVDLHTGYRSVAVAASAHVPPTTPAGPCDHGVRPATWRPGVTAWPRPPTGPVMRRLLPAG